MLVLFQGFTFLPQGLQYANFAQPLLLSAMFEEINARMRRGLELTVDADAAVDVEKESGGRSER